MRAQAAGEQSVAIRHVHDVARACAAGPDRAGHQRRPRLDVASGIADNGWFAGRAARGVHADDFGSRHGKQAERIAIPEVLLRGERKTCEIGERAQIVRMRSDRDAFLLVRGDVVVGVANRPLEPLAAEGSRVRPGSPAQSVRGQPSPVVVSSLIESRPRDARSARCSAITCRCSGDDVESR